MFHGYMIGAMPTPAPAPPPAYPVDAPGCDGAGTITCARCAAVCCRLEVLCLTDTGVPERFVDAHWDRPPVMRRLADGWCAALDRDTLRCRIYDRRPLLCREFEMGGPDCIAERADWQQRGTR